MPAIKQAVGSLNIQALPYPRVTKKNKGNLIPRIKSHSAKFVKNLKQIYYRNNIFISRYL